MISTVEFVADPTWPAPWLESHHDEKENFVKARELTLNLAQWLARIANSYVGDSSIKDRLMLDFRIDGSFVTKAFEYGHALELRLPSLEMQFQERGKLVPHVLDPEERSPAEVEAWILVELLHRGMDRDKFSKSLPYSIANLMSGDAEHYSPQACAAGLAQLTAWFRAASAVLSTHGRVVCSPQTLTLGVASGHGILAVGFSPGSAERDEPHFFTNTYDDGKHRVLTASQLANEKNPATAAAQFIEAGDVRRA
jgi:hypothetical protein